MESTFSVFTQYYGLDWLSVLFGLSGFYLVSEKNPLGFVLTFVSVLLAASVAVLAGAYGFIIANVVTAAIAIRGYMKWSTSGEKPSQEI